MKCDHIHFDTFKSPLGGTFSRPSAFVYKSVLQWKLGTLVCFQTLLFKYVHHLPQIPCQ